MSFPPQSTPPQQSSFSQPPSAPRGNRRPWGIAWLFLLAALGGTAITQAPLEIGRWHLAWAMKYRAAGEKEAAYRELGSAIKKFPRSPELLLQRAEWKLRDGERQEALADSDRAVELAGDSPRALLLRGQLLFKAGEFAKAVDDFKKVEQFSRRSGWPPRYEILNELAYAQGLAEVELNDALENANRALDLKPGDAHILDTRGYVHYVRGELDDALRDLNGAVEGIDTLRDKEQANSSRDNEPSKDQPSSLAETKSEQSQLAEASAVIHYHRALVMAALNRTEDANKDLAVARELIGREPDKTLF